MTLVPPRQAVGSTGSGSLPLEQSGTIEISLEGINFFMVARVTITPELFVAATCYST